MKVRLGVAIAVAAILLLALPVSRVEAAGKFDGTWSVQVLTEKGDCDRAYRYSIVVENGRPRYGGSEAFEVAGSVSPSGAVRVSIKRGQSSANVVGQLAGKSGAGSWSTGSNSCSGSWTADKRS
jgi:hypothetical protein